MSDLTNLEKRKLERLFMMGSGYVLDFSSRTFYEFFMDTVGLNIDDAKYNYASGSKANRLRAFWSEEPNHLTAQALRALIAHGSESGLFKNDPSELVDACRNIVARLEQASAVLDAEALQPLNDDRDFEAISRRTTRAFSFSITSPRQSDSCEA